MRIRQFVIDGLGHLSALLSDDATGVAAVLDPRRDVDVYLDAAREAGVRITHVLETHLHNDYVSGGRDLAALTGAQHVIGAGAELRYEHHGARHHEAFEVGRLRVTALHTPGHTPEHMAYAVADTSRAAEPLLLLTGGSLLVGAVGRTDLLGEANAVPWAHDMYRSLKDVVLPHEDYVGVLPTHGAGSLCSTGISSTPSSTIGFERRFNPMVRPIVEGADVEVFVRTLLGTQPAFPRYFARMRPTNQEGPALLGGRVPDPRELGVAEVRDLLAGGGLIVDTRPASAWVVAHAPGSVSIPAGRSFGTWLGWVVDPDRPLVLVLDDPAHWDDLVRQALRIGFERIAGHLRGGFAAWASATGDIEGLEVLTAGDLASRLAAGGPEAPLVVDVRQAGEYAHGHIPGSLHVAAGDLQDRLAELPRDRAIAVVCASGYRSAVGASLLARAGYRDVAWVSEGLPAWRAAGLPVEHGEARPAALAAAGPRAGTGADGHDHPH